MKFGVPWHVKGVHPDARDSAREAARRAGMSVGDWLNSVILDSAADDHPHQQAYHDPYAPPSYRSPRDPVAEQVASINHQLAGLTQGFESLLRSTAGSRAPAQEHDGTARRLADAITRLDQRVEHLAHEGRSASKALERRVEALSSLGRARPQPETWSSPMDRAMAEIHQRQHELDGDPYGRPQTTPAPRVHEDYAQINDRLRSLTEQIDTLGPGHLQGAISALRNDLADIVRTLTEASPRRAIEALEGEVRVLASRLDTRGGGSGIGFAKVEQGLAEVRDTLRTLTPAENLSGVVDAIRAVSQRIDQIATGAADPRTVQQLETAIAGLREILSHVASRDGLASLTDEVRALAARIDNAPSSARDNDVLRTLEQRIATIADAIESVRANGASGSPDIDGMVRTLGDKIERLHAAGNDHPALAQLDDRIGQLVRKLDASEQRLGNLDAIERGMKELLAYLAGTRGGGQPAQQPPVATIERDVRRAEQSIEQVHGTIGDVVDRLAMIETGIRGGGAQAAPQQAARSAANTAYQSMPVVQSPPMQASQPHVHAVAARAPQQQQTQAPRPPQMPRQAVAQMRPTADGTLPYDFPLEPGSGKPRPGMALPSPAPMTGGRGSAMASPAERIARSKAALEPAPGRPAGPLPEGEAKSNFILAARRAAQFAAESEPVSVGQAGFEDATTVAGPSPLRRVGRFVKPVLIGASLLVLIAAAIHMGVGYFTGGDPVVEAPAVKPQSRAVTPVAPRTAMPAATNSMIDPGNAASTLQGGSGVLGPVSPTPLAPAPSIPVAPPVAIAPAQPPAPVPAPKTIEVPAEKPAPAAALNLAPPPDVTGSIPTRKLPLSPPPSALFPGPQAAHSMTVPTTIGSKTLVSAAEAGDPAAAYEVAIRYVEGRGVSVNLEEASVWFERAARKGMTQAIFRLGGLYEKGTGVKKDLNRARSLYGEAAGRGHAKAMHNLAVLYAEGIDGKPDYATAVKWFHQAASRGVADSQFNLGVLFARGIGMDQNLAESFRWFSLAAQSGDNDAAQKRDDVAKRLDAQTVTAVRANIQKWTAEPQPDEAVSLHAPPGGWDAGSAPPPKAKSKRAQAGSARAL